MTSLNIPIFSYKECSHKNDLSFLADVNREEARIIRDFQRKLAGNRFFSFDGTLDYEYSTGKPATQFAVNNIRNNLFDLHDC